MSNNLSPLVPDSEGAWDCAELKRAFGTFVTGVTVVTTVDSEGVPRGMTANSFTSVSLDPPLALFCVANTSSNYAAFRDAESVAINILAEEQNDVATRFAKRVEDRFAGVSWTTEKTGSPILDATAAWFDCLRHDVLEMGDHIVVVVRIAAFGRNVQARPLAYAQGNFISFSLLEKEAQHLGTQTKVAAIAEVDGRVVLFRSGEKWGLKFEPVSEVLSHAESINLAYKPHAGRVETTFLYSVYRTQDRRETHLVYRGELQGTTFVESTNVRLFSESEIPWDRIDRYETLTALQRYFTERKQGPFGIYVHDEAGGRVSLLASGPKQWNQQEIA